MFELILDDGTARLHCRWWNLPFMEKYFAVGDEVFVFGKPVSLKPRTMDHPETEVVEGGEENFIHFNRIAPVYPLTEGLPQRWLRSLIWRTLRTDSSRISASQRCRSSRRLRKLGCTNGARSETRLQPVPPAPTPFACCISRRTWTDIEIARRRLALDEFIELQRANPAAAEKISRPRRRRCRAAATTS